MAGNDDIRRNAGKPGAGPEIYRWKRKMVALVTKRYGFAITLLLITALALVAPVTADYHVISPGGGTIQAGVDAASDGDTIILSPGTYYQNGVTISGKLLTLRADTANGHGPWDTIIDGSNAGNPIVMSDVYSFLIIDNLTLRNGKSNSGGAIYAAGGSRLTVTSSTFTGCSADNGGAISTYHGIVTITSSTFTGCSAGNGGAIFANGGGTLHFCRIYDNGPEPAVYNDIGSLDAADNWWGTNSGPAGYTDGRGITSSPWLVLGVTASPSTTTTAQTSMVRANMTYNSEGTDTSARGRIPDDIPITFSGSGSGTVFPPRGYTSSGISYTEFTPTSAGTGYITATVDGQSVTLPVTVTEPGVTATTIVIDPAAPATIYAGLDGSGIYKSTDSSAAWTAATTQPGNTRIRALVIRPGDSTKLFAGTYGGGVYNSTDSGVDWTACTPLSNQNVLSLVTDSSGKLYAGTEAGVFSSTDNCATWAEMNGGLP